ncbi:PEP-CTERM sorting domain-containing protein [Akkermansiaceae bacterium]|nr:PEP-CTERM sorting domain-containing protein [Akkermansiaceae bacterium]
MKATNVDTMITTVRLFFIIAATSQALSIGSAGAAVIASTNFNGQTIVTNTASNLGWTLNGVNDPGSMSAFVAATATTQNLFNTNTFNQNQFAPALNVGNGNTFWRTSVNLTVTAGNVVSLTDVTFDHWAINGSGVQNVNRRSDFTITLFDPSNTPVAGGTVSAVDVFNGASPGVSTPVTLTFASAVALSATGTYRLQIDAGELGGADETGNHAGIDNLSINGTVTPVPEPTSLAISVLGFLGLALRRKRAA